MLHDKESVRPWAYCDQASLEGSRHYSTLRTDVQENEKNRLARSLMKALHHGKLYESVTGWPGVAARSKIAEALEHRGRYKHIPCRPLDRLPPWKSRLADGRLINDLARVFVGPELTTTNERAP